MATLYTPQNTATQGAFTATLSWNGTGDVDLHTFEPNGSHVYYSNQKGIVGELDVDNTVANGPEHYFATCNESLLEEGIYRIGLNNYSQAEGRKATVQISTSNVSDVITREMVMGPELGSSGDSNPKHLINVVVSKDESGKFNISTH